MCFVQSSDLPRGRRGALLQIQIFARESGVSRESSYPLRRMAASREEFKTLLGYYEDRSYDKLHKQREPGFISSAVSERTPGGQCLALPNWSIVPLVYHCPLPVDYSQLLPHPLPDPYTDLYTVPDGNGLTWTFENSERIVQKHKHTMCKIQAKLTEAFTAMKDDLDFWRAVQCLESARSRLWSCHKESSLDFTIGTHMGHAILRAAVLQNPEIHKQQVKTLLLRSLKEFESTRKGIERCVHNKCTISLRFSCIIGIGWIHLFQGKTKSANDNLCEALTLKTFLDTRHFRGGDRDFDSIFLKWALFEVQGKVDDLQEISDNQLGFIITDREEDRHFVALLEMGLQIKKGLFQLAIDFARNIHFKERDLRLPFRDCATDPVLQAMEQLQAGYVGNAWLLLGASREAERSYETAMYSGGLLLTAAAQVGLGNVCMRRGGAIGMVSNETGYESAAKFYQRASAVYDELGFKGGQTIVYCNMGILSHRQNRLNEALEWYEKAVRLHGSDEMTGPVFELNFQIARLYFERKNWEKADKSLRLAEECAKNASTQHLQGAICLAKMLDDRRHIPPALKLQEGSIAGDHFKKAIEDNSRVQIGLEKLHPLWLTIFEQQKDVYEQLVWCIASTPGPITDRGVQALVWSERSRSRLLMFEEWKSFFDSVTEFLTEEDATALHNLKLEAFDSSEEKLSWESIEFLLKRSQERGTVIIEYNICADFGIVIFVIMIGFGIVDMLQIPFTAELTRQTLSDMVTKLVSNLGQHEENTDSDDEETLKQLYKILLKPVEKHITETKQLIIVPHEILFNVPFHALIDDEQRFFIERMPLSFAESLRSLLRCWSAEQKNESLRQRNEAVRRTLVVGINKHRKHRVLKFAQKEAQSVASTLTSKFGYREGTLLLGNSATKEKVRASLQDVDIIHVASHGVVNEFCEEGALIFAHSSISQSNSQGDSLGSGTRGAPAHARFVESLRSSLSALVGILETAVKEEEVSEDSLLPNLRSRFSPEDDQKVDKELDEIALKAEELQGLHLSAQLAVLSACQTAQGVILGEGVAGLGRALLRAGVRCTILSQWQVSDRETSALMEDIYHELVEGLSVSAAMRKAMVKVITKDAARCEFSVRTWAPFAPLGLSFLPISKPHKVQQISKPERVPQKQTFSITATTSFYWIVLIGVVSFVVFYFRFLI